MSAQEPTCVWGWKEIELGRWDEISELNHENVTGRTRQRIVKVVGFQLQVKALNVPFGWDSLPAEVREQLKQQPCQSPKNHL